MRVTRTSQVVVESVTPRIDSECRCRCGANLVWDEVYGWVHAATPGERCAVPAPAPD